MKGVIRNGKVSISTALLQYSDACKINCLQKTGEI